MEIQDFKNYIDDPVKMQEEDFEKIQSLLEKYPFFHTANLLFVKAAHNINHEIYNTAISRVSASVPNREMLHELITLKEIKIIPTENKKEKKEESQTRKDIRERIQKRREKRTVVIVDGLKDDGKSRHESLINLFFEPIFNLLRKSPNDFNVVIEREIENKAIQEEVVETTVVDEREKKKIEREKRMAEKRRLRAEQTTDEDKEKAKLEREKKKAERNKRMAEKVRLKEEKTENLTKESEKEPPAKEIIIEDKPIPKIKEDKVKIDSKVTKEVDIVKEQKEDKIEEDINAVIESDEIIIESETPVQKKETKAENDVIKNKEIVKEEIKIENDDLYTKIITIPSGEEKKEIETELSDEISIETESKPEVDVPEATDKNKTDKKIKSTRSQRKSKKDEVIIEEINIDNNISGDKEEGVVIESIYDKIISSKKPKKPSKKHVFIEITDDITGLIPDEEVDDISGDKKKADIVAEVKSEEPKIKEDIKLDKKASDIEINIETDVKPEKEQNKDKKEDIPVVDKVTEIETKKPKEEVKQDSKDIEIEINVDKNDEIEFIIEDTTDTKEVVEKIKDEKVITDESPDETFELIEKKAEKISEKNEAIGKIKEKSEKPKLADSKKEEKTGDSQKPKLKTEAKPEQKKEIVKETDTKKAPETKAANDVFARIAAFKNKKSENEETVEESKDSEELIQKFVDEKPGMKRNEIDESENVDISEDSTKVKKPVITELMASIYVNQGKYEQAIDIFEKLILKNPEKKDYFAAKIKETEKLK